jgi:hypothetical protein
LAHTLAEAKRFADQFNEMGMVGKTVEQSRGQAFISEDFIMPSFEDA